MQSLEATLPAIIFICDVFHLSLQEQDYQKRAGIQECYYFVTYKNAATYKDATRTDFEANNDAESEMDGIPKADQHFSSISRLPMSQLLIIQSIQARPFQASPCEHYLLRLPSHDCL